MPPRPASASPAARESAPTTRARRTGTGTSSRRTSPPAPRRSSSPGTCTLCARISDSSGRGARTASRGGPRVLEVWELSASRVVSLEPSIKPSGLRSFFRARPDDAERVTQRGRSTLMTLLDVKIAQAPEMRLRRESSPTAGIRGFFALTDTSTPRSLPPPRMTVGEVTCEVRASLAVILGNGLLRLRARTKSSPAGSFRLGDGL